MHALVAFECLKGCNLQLDWKVEPSLKIMLENVSLLPCFSERTSFSLGVWGGVFLRVPKEERGKLKITYILAFRICCFNILVCNLSQRGKRSPYQLFQFYKLYRNSWLSARKCKTVPNGQGTPLSFHVSYVSRSSCWVSSFRLGCRKSYILRWKDAPKVFFSFRKLGWVLNSH